MCVPAEDGIDGELVEVFGALRIVNERDGDIAVGGISEGFLGMEVRRPQVAESDEAEPLPVDVEEGGFIFEDGDSLFFEVAKELDEDGVSSFGRHKFQAVVVIAEAGEGTESAFDSAEQRGDLFPVPAEDVVGDVVAG